MTTYTLAGGCFWCLDAVFRRLKGVESSVCGYTGGSARDADYYTVATGETGHVEAVQVTFSEATLPPETLLDIFFLIHDPTTRNRQGADIGSQYASAMYYVDEAQRGSFEAAIKRAQQHWDAPIVTQVDLLDRFYPAESEHQNYFHKNPLNGYCSVVIAPKITKARQTYERWFAVQ